ncbi:uncharacterized protein [Chelonus insularis]|uniref:uncharacterized protein n=1 Tax=Chelonus insularis TaxID=460826 RepID=UPI00158CE367|nr:uncharacterized protein LOC118070649 [Chelonus insularis]
MDNQHSAINSAKVFNLQKIFIYVLFITTKMNWNFVCGEWIELPQFSNKFKVYRLADLKDDSTIINPEIAMSASMNSMPENFEKIKRIVKTQNPFEINHDFLLKKKIIFANNSNANLPDISVFTIPPMILKNGNINDSISSEFLTKVHSDQYKTNNSSKNKQSSDSTNSKNSIKEVNSQQSFFDHFPLKLFNIVHKILLNNHARTFEVKYHYLNNLRENLLEDIAPILSSKIILGSIGKSNRKKRSYHEEHEQHIGFPSLEGALLAISFLTFSVYLIQLVMMLLRNIASNPTTTTGTVLVNRNKRFINELQNSTKICEYIYEFNGH